MKAFMQWLRAGVFAAGPKIKLVKSVSPTRRHQLEIVMSPEEKGLKEAEESLKTFWLRGWR